MDSITSFADGLFEPISGKAGKEQMSTIYLSELYGAGLEALSEMFFTPLGSTIVQGIAGLGLSAAAVTLDMPERLRTELMEIGSHEVFRFVELLPKKAGEVSENVSDLVEGLKAGDLERIKAATLKDFENLLRDWGVKTPTKISSNVAENEEEMYEEVPLVADEVSEGTPEEEEEEILAA